MKAKKLIEVAMPIKEISAESVRDKSIRHGHISTLHLWWARRQTLRDNGLRIEVKFTATSNNALPLTENSQIYKSVKESASQLGLNLTEEE